MSIVLSAPVPLEKLRAGLREGSQIIKSQVGFELGPTSEDALEGNPASVQNSRWRCDRCDVGRECFNGIRKTLWPQSML